MRVGVSIVLATCACGSPAGPAGHDEIAADTDATDTDMAAHDNPPNILVMVLDDVGIDAVSTYGAQPLAVHTPSLDRLAAEGVRFNHAWAMPECMPARAALLTGRMPHRTGIGTSIGPFDRTGGLPLSEITIAELLRAAPTPYSTAAIGKWHLSSQDQGGRDAPNLQGFDHYRGAIGNLLPGHTVSGARPSYTRWEETVDGVTSWRRGYVTNAEVDDALDQMQALPEPWFVYLAFHAAHAPYQPPPGIPGVGQDSASQYDATLSALDTEIGRLLDEMTPELLATTVVVVIGDNGTPGAAVRPPFDPDFAKFSVFEGGVHVPLIVRWPGVAMPATQSDALVSIVDLFPTIAAAAGVAAQDLPVIDGVDLAPALRDPANAPGHELLFSENFTPNGVSVARELQQAAVRDARWKLVRFPAAGDFLFDLQDRWIEGESIEPAAQSPESVTEARLASGLDAILASMPRDPAP